MDSKRKKVFVSGCYDMLHSGHVAFFKEASQYGDLYVGIGSDSTIIDYKKRKPVYSEKERLYMVKAIRYVTDAYINPGHGIMDFIDTVDRVKPDVFVVNTDGGSAEKREFCRQRGIEYVELRREPDAGLDARSTTQLRAKAMSGLPYRIDLAGTWIDQPYVSEKAPGWALTISIEPTNDFMERAGMATSTRNSARRIWPYELPNYDEEMMAKLLFCFENDPENGGHISGAQDAIGMCVAGLSRHYYDNCYWPKKIEVCRDEAVLSWLESHLCLVPMFPRRDGVSVVEGRDVTEAKVLDLAAAADRCWQAIMDKDIRAFARAFTDSFDAQVSMFPAMMQPGVQDYIDKAMADGALACKMCGAGGGGYLCLVVDKVPEWAIPVRIRRE